MKIKYIKTVKYGTRSFCSINGAWMLHLFSRVQRCVTPWIVARQAPLSLGFSRQEYWSGLPCPLSGDLPNPGIDPGSPALQVGSLLSEPPGKPKMEPK